MLTIDVCIASYNTKAATELTIRSARRRAGIDARLVVGDGASTDGTLTMLEALERDGAISIERWPGRRLHKDWLDHWYGTSDADYLVFSDSDVFYRRDGWLRDLVDTAEREGAALVAARIQPDWSQRPRWADGTATTLPGERPEPCLMLLDLRQLRGVVAASFAYHEEPLVDRPGHKLRVRRRGGLHARGQEGRIGVHGHACGLHVVLPALGWVDVEASVVRRAGAPDAGPATGQDDPASSPPRLGTAAGTRPSHSRRDTRRAEVVRFHWYWPFAREEELEWAVWTARPGESVVVQVIDREHAPASGAHGPVTVVRDLPTWTAASGGRCGRRRA